MAGKILGLIPIEHSDMILALTTVWFNDSNSNRIYEIIIKDGLDTLRKEKPSIYLNYFKSFINSNNVIKIKIGYLRFLTYLKRRVSLISKHFTVLKPISNQLSSRNHLRYYFDFTLLSKKSPIETFHLLIN
jgi:hypothetical protein